MQEYPFHETWSKRKDEKIVDFRARGLVGIGTIFDKYVEKEMGKELTPNHGIKNICNSTSVSRFSVKIMSNSRADELKIKVRRQVCRNTTILQFNFDKTW